jgi:predicted SPOUT superfamily RNA methylase MTH1
MDRPRHGQEDGRTVLQKAMDLKEARNIVKAMTQKTSFAFESNEELLRKAHSVNISFGNNDNGVQEKLESLKQKELSARAMFVEKNPEVNLPNNLDIEILAEDFPPLNNSPGSLKDPVSLESESWVDVASKSCVNSINKVNNDRSFLECERP